MQAKEAARLRALRDELARCYADYAAVRKLLAEQRQPAWMRRRWLLALLRGALWLAAGRYAFLTHWIVRRVLRRSGLFDGAWYLRTYPDIAREGDDPLRHYVQFGAAEGRWPNPYFVPDWYRLQCPHVAALDLNPLLHYIRAGAARGLSPHPNVLAPEFLAAWPEARAYPTVLHYIVAKGLPDIEKRPQRPAPVRAKAPPLVTPAGKPAAGAGAGRRVCAFSHFDAEGRILGYVRYHLAALARQGFEIHLISAAPRLDAADRAAVEALGAKIYLRENTGRDFGSWQWGLREIPALKDVDTLLLANDSVFGPLFDLADVFAAMRAEPADVWGITDSLEVRWHLQSYFLCLSRRAHESRAFNRILAQDFDALGEKLSIVRKGEILLSQALVAEGLVARAYCPYERISPVYNMGKWMNPMYYSWDALIIEQRCPYLKLDLLRDNPQNIRLAARWRAVIEGFTIYDSSLIDDFLGRTGRSGLDDIHNESAGSRPQ